jgi:MFS-type transporter involved in bile tolerance (Atg22 family)
MIVWGIGLGAQDSLLKAVLANVVPVEKRSTAFGVFDTGFGVAWFAGSAAMGWLYDRSVPALIVFSVFLQLVAVPVLFLAERAATKHKIS